MKKIFIALITLTIISCSKEQNNFATISGKITNNTSDSITIRNSNYSKKIVVSEDGTFKDTLNIKTGVYFFADDNERTSVYLKNGFDINLTIDTKMFDESASYNGNGAENSNFLAKKYMNSEENPIDRVALFSLNEAEFLSKIDETKNSKNDFLNSFPDLDADFIELESKVNYFDFLMSLSDYESYHKYYSKEKEFEVTNAFLNPLDNIDYTNDKDYNSIASYKQLVQKHFAYKIVGEDIDIAKVFVEYGKINSKNIKNDIARNLAFQIRPGLKNNDLYYNGILNISSDQVFKDKLTEKYNKVQKLAEGQPSPQFTNFENNDGSTTSLSDLKGKYVYIDVWATWCGPCKAEIPYLKVVEEKYHGKNIAFVSISVDVEKSHEAWKDMVAEKELGGIQLFADKDWSSQFVKDYAIEGIPRFILIDPKGNIISGSAPRPSSDSLIKLFDEHNI